MSHIIISQLSRSSSCSFSKSCTAIACNPLFDLSGLLLPLELLRTQPPDPIEIVSYPEEAFNALPIPRIDECMKILSTASKISSTSFKELIPSSVFSSKVGRSFWSLEHSSHASCRE